MDDFKIKKALKTAFDDFELSPNEDLFAKITDRVNEQNKERSPISKFVNYRYLGLAALFFSLGTVYFLSINLEKTTEINKKNLGFDSKLSLADNSVSKKKIPNKNFAKEIINENISYSLNTNDKEIFINKVATTNKNEIQSKTTRIANRKQFLHQKIKPENVFNDLTINYLPKNENNKPLKFELNNIENNEAIETLGINKNQFDDSDIKNLYVGNNNLSILSNEIILKNLKGLSSITLNSSLKMSKLPKVNIPKKDLPKINKTTPLAIEVGINPFYAFQKIEPTEAGLTTIQNISTGNINTKQRLGFAINAAYVLNWTKQSRLRLGVSYRDIFQKVGYEQATDIYDLQTINNQTVLVRKGIPYAEEKRNQLIGIKADRQFFLQLSTPTRFYASLGAEYTKALKSKTQMLFVNSTMGIDMPLKNKWRLQIEPSYSYALLGTTDANKFVNINPNHLGLKFGLLYEIRK